ncbi:MAG: phytanoyl-CoA dioxygenase family protein [Anaerolineae bacterium]|nr:phytanoyl-CoA dioxygenase family protein [Thermoflexales bacterium]MDW8408664.1 phytanoyl-CoA dioxygenase family protein [Anaerolineae bacterium]
MLTAEQVQAYKTNGFVLGGRVLSDEQVEELRSELQRVIDHHDRLERRPVRIVNLSGKPDAPVWQIVNMWQASDAFKALMFNCQMVEAAAQLSGARELRIWHDQIQYKPQQTGGVNMWHQDSPYWPNIAPLDAQITAWVALDDVDESNGCMSMVPGSHLWGKEIDFLHTLKDFNDMPSEYKGHQIEVRLCPVPKGYVHYHHPLTWHGSHANRSGRPRRAIAFHFMTQDTIYVESGNHIMKPYVTVEDGEMLQGDAFPRVWPQ